METYKLITNRTKKLSEEVSELVFSFDGYIYNPLDYAWNAHSEFIEKYITHKVDTIFLGMNPGPFGMMQTGVPFGEINAVKNYLKIGAHIGKPQNEHPNRPVEGMNIKRSEISGLRFWGMVQDFYPEPSEFFKTNAVFNYCPLGFISSVKTAKNITPESLVKSEREALDRVCLNYLADIVEILEPKYLVGIGKYAEEKLKKVAGSRFVTSIIHPSPGNPMANNGWKEKTIGKLRELGIWN